MLNNEVLEPASRIFILILLAEANLERYFMIIGLKIYIKYGKKSS